MQEFPFVVDLPEDLIMGTRCLELCIEYANWLEENIEFEDFILPHDDKDYATTAAFKNEEDAVLFRLWIKEL